MRLARHALLDAGKLTVCAGYFTDTLKAFDFHRRIKILNDKLAMAMELQSFLNDKLESKYSHRLEWIIILLIVRRRFPVLCHSDSDFASLQTLEVALALMREGLP